jgi:hypothetical protein
MQSAIKNRLWLILPTLVFVLALWLDVFPFLRGPQEWRWTLRAVESPLRMSVPIIALALYSILCARWWQAFAHGPSSRAVEYSFLSFLTIAAPLIQLALAYAVSRDPLLEFFGPTVSVHNSGYFTTAVATTDLNSLLVNYPAVMPQLPIHAQSHPPGPIVMQWLTWKFFQAWPSLADSIAMPLRTLQCHNPGLMALDNPQIASATIGMALPLMGALAVWPMFALGKRIAGSRTASIAVALFPVMPLFAMWPAQWDQLYPWLLLTGLYFAHTGLELRSTWRIFLAGVPLSIATFFSVGNFVLMMIVGLYGLTWLIINHPDTKTPRNLRAWVSLWLQPLLTFVLGCASIWLGYVLLYRVNPLDVISTGSRLAIESTTGNRTYLVWLIWNPIDFAIFLGVPIVIALLMNLARKRWNPHLLVGKPSPSLWPLMAATFGVLVILDLFGIVRGEVGRLWMYFGPLMLLITARGVGRGARSEDITYHSSLAPALAGSARVTRHSLLISLLALQLLVMNTRWLVNDYFLDEPPARTANFVAPQPSDVTADSFDRQIALRGYDARRTGGTLDVTLYWQALSQPPHAYTVFVHALDANGQPAGQQDNMPQHDQLPTSCWQPGEYVSDPYTLHLPDGARDPLTIEVGLYRLETGERLSLDDGLDTSVRLKVP